jgi:hypothetical protein
MTGDDDKKKEWLIERYGEGEKGEPYLPHPEYEYKLRRVWIERLCRAGEVEATFQPSGLPAVLYTPFINVVEEMIEHGPGPEYKALMRGNEIIMLKVRE